MEKKFLGVCVWIAKKTNIEITWVRVGFVVATILGLGAPILIYFAIYLMLDQKWIE